MHGINHALSPPPLLAVAVVALGRVRRRAGVVAELARVIKVVPHPTWVANPVVVPKPKSSKLRLSVDFTDLNKACPKDPFPLPRIGHNFIKGRILSS